MPGIFISSILGLAILASALKIAQWQKYYRQAFALGFPVFYSPVHIAGIWWKLMEPLLLPLAERLPDRWTRPWLSVSQVWAIWKNGYKPFREAGNDTFVLATPDGNVVWTCETTVIQQLFRLHPRVEVPTEYLKFFDVYGPTLGSSEGDVWKVHRKAVSAGLGTAINKAVWEESQLQTRTLIDYIHRARKGEFDILRHYTSTLALHTIAGRFYGMHMNWDDHEDAKSIPAGHEIHFDKAISWTTKHIITLSMTPRALLELLPGTSFKEASVGFSEMTKYINEFRAAASQDLNGLSSKRNKTMLESIVLSATDPEDKGKTSLSDGSVIGNIFFTMLAGHETTGSALGFSLLLLAVYPEYQKKIQQELDSHFQGRAQNDWSYEEDFKFVFRRALDAIDIVDGKGRSHTIPKGTLFVIDKAAHNNHPERLQIRAGVTSAQLSALAGSPALYFSPERWLGRGDEVEPTAAAQDDGAAGLPYFQPFGEGNRACPGRGFAQTEMTAIMATLFKDFCLELVVDEETLRAHQGNAQHAWVAVQERAIKMLYEDVEANITLGMNKVLPIRVVPRS